MILYAPRLPADPLARSECIRSFVCSLRALQAPCLGTTLGGTPPPDPHHQDPPPGPPTPPHPNHPSVRVEGYSEWMAIPSGWLFQVHGCSEGSYFHSTQGRAQTQSMQKALTASVGSLYLLSSHNAAPLVRIARSTQEHTKTTQEHLGAHASTQEHLSPSKPNATHSFNGAKS